MESFYKYNIDMKMTERGYIVHVYNTNRQGFKALVPDYSYRFHTATDRQEWVDKFKADYEKRQQDKKQRRTTNRDTRSMEIKKLLKKYYPNAEFKVRIDKYSMGESINVSTNAFKIDRVPDPRGYGYVMQASEQDSQNREQIKHILSKYERVDRDQWGEILSGGNTFLFVEPMD